MTLFHVPKKANLLLGLITATPVSSHMCKARKAMLVTRTKKSWLRFGIDHSPIHSTCCSSFNWKLCKWRRSRMISVPYYFPRGSIVNEEQWTLPTMWNQTIHRNSHMEKVLTGAFKGAHSLCPRVKHSSDSNNLASPFCAHQTLAELQLRSSAPGWYNVLCSYFLLHPGPEILTGR